jgi:hypothetical protein
MIRRAPIVLLALLAACWGFQGMKASAAAPEPPQLLRDWLLTGPAGIDDDPASATWTAAPPDASWIQYVQGTRYTAPDAREKALRALYRQSGDPLLRGVIQRAIAEDPNLLSRQARFIRHYGFYANWFNRTFYTAGRLVQGNLSAGVQYIVETIADLFRASEANPYDRQALDMMHRASALGILSAKDRARLGALEQRVHRAEAAEDLDRARWALEEGLPDAAYEYAGSALILRPVWRPALRLQAQADHDRAEALRRGLASTQVGFPDRVPRVDPADPALVRASLTTATLENGDSEDEAALWTRLRAASRPGQGAGSIELPRGWTETLDVHASGEGSGLRLWAEALLDNPHLNPDLRLRRAQARQRGHVARYIFLGPESKREKVFKAASWAAQTYDAMSRVGFFYVFEVLGRSFQSLVAAPVPPGEVLDAQAAWLRAAPRPLTEEAKEITGDWARACLREGRFDDARRLFDQAGLMSQKLKREIDRAEGRFWARMAEDAPAGPMRRNALARAAALNPKAARTLEIKWAKEAKKTLPPPAPLRLDWDVLRAWSRNPLPAGLPGDPVWFDGQPANGEVTARGMEWAPLPGGKQARLTYQVQFPKEMRIHQATVDPQSLPPAVAGAMKLAQDQQEQARRTIHDLERLPVPFEVEGGLGASGVDLYPKLLPMNLPQGRAELYE